MKNLNDWKSWKGISNSSKKYLEKGSSGDYCCITGYDSVMD